MDDIFKKVLFLVVLILLSAYFSATETAFSSLNTIKLKSMAQNGNKKANKTLELLENYDKLLSTILIGNNIVNILSASLSTALFVLYFPNNGVLYSTVVMTLVVLTFGEILPKSIAKEMPEKFAIFATSFIYMLLIILTPANFAFSKLKNFVSKIFNIKQDRTITDREILTIVEEAKSEGCIDEDESTLLKSAIEFYDLEVSDILTPRVDVIGIEKNSTPEEIKEIFHTSGYSRLPVYNDTIDNILGIINEKDFFYNNTIDETILPAIFVPENMKISKLVSMLRQKKQHLAIVCDEYGGTVGVVSLEDALEELVGDIWDEHDLIKREFIKISDTRYRISGSANLDKMFEIFDISPDVEYESTSVNGWVNEVLGHLPESGEKFEIFDISITVLKINQNRISYILAAKKPKALNIEK